MKPEIRYVDRRGTSCKKWDNQTAMFGADGLMGLWVADMDFRAADPVIDALRKAVDFGVFGYVYPWDGYYEAVMDWEWTRHGYRVEKDWICFSPGVVPGFNWLMLANSEPGDSVLVLTPSYYPMLEAPVKNGRRLVTSDLIVVDGAFRVDFADFERKIAENRVKVFLLCSPHNPSGRVWEEYELRRMMDICRKHGVYVVSDEIHQDIVIGGHKHIPTAMVGEYDDMLATLIAASKTFNLAGLQNASVILPDAAGRARYSAFTAGIRVLYGNTLGYVAAEAAYKTGGAWLNEILHVISENEKLVRSALTAAIPGIFIPELQGTYLLWLDFSRCLRPEEMADFFETKCGLAMDYGNWFGGNPCCVRMNLATRRENLEKAAAAIIREYQKLGRAQHGGA